MEAIGHLTGGIAHDFNNILTSIMGYIVLAAERPRRHGDAKLGNTSEQAQPGLERARDLIQQMLTFSRGQRGEPRPLSPAAAGSASRSSCCARRCPRPSSSRPQLDARPAPA